MAGAWLPRGAWNLCRPGIERVSPALAGGFSPLDHQGSPGPLSVQPFLSYFYVYLFSPLYKCDSQHSYLKYLLSIFIQIQYID